MKLYPEVIDGLYRFPAIYNLIRTVFFGLKPSFETIRYRFIFTKQRQFFHIVSSGRNSGENAIKCLESVYNQTYDKNYVRHVYIDDSSCDDSDKLIKEWLKTHPDHCVEYIRRNKRMGGCHNNLYGMFKAPPKSIVVELNGDDWLADNNVLKFLNKIYADKNVWQTYNSHQSPSGVIWINKSRPITTKKIKQNRIREFKKWTTGHLHSFRQELMTHLEEASFIDPLTGEYWEKADDVALYCSLLELAGTHSKHIYRALYVFNLRKESDHFKDPAGQIERASRIKLKNKYSPLQTLEANSAKKIWHKLSV